MLDARVLGPGGPVANAVVEVVALPTHGCPCRADDAKHGGGAFPACSCPAAAAMWQSLLEECALPGVLARASADEHGQVAVPAIAGSTLLVSGSSGGRRFALPKLRAGLAFELAATQSPRIKLSGDPRDLRAAVVFEDGYCVPLQPRGDAWQPARPFPEDESGVIVAANRDGFTAVSLSTLDDEVIDIHPTRSITGVCTNATSAVLEGPFQRLTARVDAGGRFQFADVLGFDARIRCSDDLGVNDSLFYRAQDGSVEGMIDASHDDEDCEPVEVIGRSGEPIAGAQVIGWSSAALSEGVREGASVITDDHGRACLPALGVELEAVAPLARGGRCAGRARQVVTAGQRLASRSSPTRITLEIRRLPRATLQGRVQSSERFPVAGATVYVVQLSPSDVPGCSESYVESTTTALDGSFTLTLPRGKRTLLVRHPWYVDERVEADGLGSHRAIVVGRGASWHGRVLDPDGAAIERCSVALGLRDERWSRASCSATGFALTVLPPGTATLIADVVDHPVLGERRRLQQTVTIAANERRRADLRWPPGALIAGTVVDPQGAAIAGARLSALPAGVDPHPSQFMLDEVVVQADAAGRFAFHHMRPGVWTIRSLGTSEQVQLDATTGTTDIRFVTPR